MSVLAVLVAVAGLYLAGARRLAAAGARGGERRPSPWPMSRTAAFLAGLAVLAAALLTPRADDLLSAHVVEHLLMAMVAAPLLAAGAPAALALRALRGPARRSLADAVRSRPARVLTRPGVAWALLAAVTVGVHVPVVYEAALGSPPLHAVEHMLLLGSAVLFWLPLVGVNPVRHRPSALGGVLLLLLAMLPMTAVGVTLTAASEALYSAHLEAARELGASALADQRAAGAIMWVGGSLLLVAAVLAFGMRALLREERREVARERHADAHASPPEPAPFLTGGAR
jgi:cytochrome c oxidase assembly factor CtaG